MLLPAALAFLLVPLIGCGGEDDERRAAREELERRFGPREEASPPESPAATDAGGPAAEPPDAAASEGSGEGGEPPPGGEREEPDRPVRSEEGGATPSEGGVAAEPPPTPAAGQEIDPGEWLTAADRAYRALPSLRARFEQRVEVPLLDRTSLGVGVWYQEGGDRFRMDFTDPPEDVFVADGTYLWLYQPSVQPDQVIRSELDGGRVEAGTADLLGRILAEARSGYDAAYEGREEVSGVPTRVIALTPRGPSEYRLVRVWIAERDRLVRRFRIEQENETIRTVTLSDLEPGVPMPDSLFRFEPPPGVDVYAAS